MAAATGLLAGNLIAPADSDFELPLTGNWTAGANTTPARSSTAFTGGSAAQLKATANGSVSMTYTAVPVAAEQGYTFSGWVRFANPGRSGQITVTWKNSGGSTISTSSEIAVFPAAGAYAPLQLAAAAPAAAVTAVIGIVLGGLTASEAAQLDTMYAAPTLCQVLVAWPSSPLSTTPLWADMTPWTRADKAISYSRARPDEIQQVQPGTGGCTFDNTAGYFVPGSAPWPLALGKRLRFNMADELGVFHNRYDAYINGLVPGWTGATGAESVVTCSASDLLARLTRAPSMRTMVEEEMLLDGPIGLYTLADPAGSTYASDSSGNSAPPLEYVTTGGGSSIAFGSGTGIIGFAAPGFTSSSLPCPKWTTAADEVAALQGYLLSPVSASAGFTIELWFDIANMSGAANTMLNLINSRTRAQLQVGFLTPESGHGLSLTYFPVATAAGVNANSGVVPTTGQLVIVVSGTTATAYINGTSVASVTIGSAATFDYISVGGTTANMSNIAGSLSCCGIYNSVLSSGRRAAHYSAGSGQNWGDSIVTLASNILTYAGVPSAMVSMPASGVSYADAYEISGQTPMSILQTYQQVDGGVFYMTGAGNIKFADRATRYASVASPALTLAAGQYEPDLTFPLTDQFLINDATFGNSNIPGGVRAQNTASITASGEYPSGDPLSPTTGPWYSYPWDPSLGIADSDVLADAAAWTANIYGTPTPRSPNLMIDLATQPSSEFSRATAFAVDNSSVIVLAGLPATAPAGTLVSYLMVEGVTESLTRTDQGVTWTLKFNTSPAIASAAWVPGDPVMGVLDSTAIVGRGTDGSPNGGSPRYVGPPYPVPAFSSSMNRTGNVGAQDLRGLWANVQQAITPPVFALQQVSLAQSVPNNSPADVGWDLAWYDTADGWNLQNVYYVVQVPGIYKLRACVPFAANVNGDRRAYFQQNGSEVAGRESIEAIVASDYVSLFIAATVECAAGDQLKVTAFQNSGGSLAVPTTNGGAVFSGVLAGT